MPGKFNLEDYVRVHERLANAGEDIFTITADPVAMVSPVMGHIRVVVVLRDGRSASGTASFRLDLEGKSAQATNPIEDCETSALGRALAFLGYESSRGIASREEMVEAQRRRDVQPEGAPRQARQAPAGNGEPASDKQRGYLESMLRRMEWPRDRFAEFLRERGISWETMTRYQASQVIDELGKAQPARA